MALTTDQLTAREMRGRGYHCVKVEHYVWFPGIKEPRKRDFLGFADYIAWNDTETVLVQTTSKSNHSARRNKILDAEFFRKWMRNPRHKVLVQSWEKKGVSYICKDEYMTLEMADSFEVKRKEKEDKATAHMKNWTSDDFARHLHPEKF